MQTVQLTASWSSYNGSCTMRKNATWPCSKALHYRTATPAPICISSQVQSSPTAPGAGTERAVHGTAAMPAALRHVWAYRTPCADVVRLHALHPGRWPHRPPQLHNLIRAAACRQERNPSTGTPSQCRTMRQQEGAWSTGTQHPYEPLPLSAYSMLHTVLPCQPRTGMRTARAPAKGHTSCTLSHSPSPTTASDAHPDRVPSLPSNADATPRVHARQEPNPSKPLRP